MMMTNIVNLQVHCILIQIDSDRLRQTDRQTDIEMQPSMAEMIQIDLS